MLSLKLDGAGRVRLLRPGFVQPDHRLAIPPQHRRLERGLTAHVLGLEVSAQFDQECKNVVALAADREMQRRQAAFEARQATVERIRILFHQFLNQVQVAGAHGGEDMVPRTALDQERQQLPSLFQPSWRDRRPARQ